MKFSHMQSITLTSGLSPFTHYTQTFHSYQMKDTVVEGEWGWVLGSRVMLFHGFKNCSGGTGVVVQAVKLA